MNSIGGESSSSVTEPLFMLDANCCIYLIEKLSPPLRARMERCPPGSVITSAIVFAEVGKGTDWGNEEAAALVNDFFDVVTIIPFDRAAARRYGDLPFARHRLDRLIAAHALALNVTLVTANVRDFANIPHLTVENWTR